MRRIAKWVIPAVAVFIVVALFLSRPAAIPEWRMQVVDENGQPLSGVIVHQEWTNLELDGMTYADSKTTDGEGWVNLPARRIRGSWALRIQDRYLARSKGRKSLLSTRAFVCAKGRAGDTFWNDLSREPPHQLQLQKGVCAFD
jgi:hypothetical protein